MDLLLDLLKIILPAGAVFAAAYLIVKRFLDNDQQRREQDLKRMNQASVTPLRLQAYERIVIFLERINPSSLVVRVNRSGVNAQQFHMELIKTVKSEYEHNLSQQIYMSHNSWELVKNAKEEVIKLINITATKVPHDNQGSDLAMAILNVTGNIGKKFPTDIAIDYIKKEVNGIF
jgi:DNA-binding Xre family transcriptional regulator